MATGQPADPLDRPIATCIVCLATIEQPFPDRLPNRWLHARPDTVPFPHEAVPSPGSVR